MIEKHAKERKVNRKRNKDGQYSFFKMPGLPGNQRNR